MHRHNDAMPVVSVLEDVVASLDAIELPATPFERADRSPRRHRG